MTGDLAAFSGLVELVHWQQDSSGGARIKLGLWERHELEHFDKAAKRNKRHAGQRYHAFWQDPPGTPVEGMPEELWFLGASWSTRLGPILQFALHGDDLQPFMESPARDNSLDPKFWFLMLVELGDDDKPIDQQQREKLEALTPKQPRGGPLSKNAGILCGDPDFKRFLQAKFQKKIETDEEAAQVVREHCDVTSRAWLDYSADAAKLYELLKQDFYLWGRKYA